MILFSLHIAAQIFNDQTFHTLALKVNERMAGEAKLLVFIIQPNTERTSQRWPASDRVLYVQFMQASDVRPE